MFLAYEMRIGYDKQMVDVTLSRQKNLQYKTSIDCSFLYISDSDNYNGLFGVR